MTFDEIGFPSQTGREYVGPDRRGRVCCLGKDLAAKIGGADARIGL